MMSSKIFAATTIVVALSLGGSEAFVQGSNSRTFTSAMRSAVVGSDLDRNQPSSVEIDQSTEAIIDHESMTADISKNSVSPRRRRPEKKKAHGNEGPLSPLVLALKQILGEEDLNKLRGKVIGMHSDVISSFVDTHETPFGQSVLRQLFSAADLDRNGLIDEKELNSALMALGFDFLKEKQVQGILSRADENDDGGIDVEEWMTQAPKTLRANLKKLAKKNGGSLGLLA